MADKKLPVVQPKDKIQLIPGHTNILLIAPHGVEKKPFDDENTAELTRQIRARLGCSAVINTAYWKPDGEKEEGRNNGKIDVKNNFLNLNRIDHAKHLSDFTDKITEIVDTDGLTYVFWIHGIADANIKNQTKLIPTYKKKPDELHALIGYGQGPDRNIPKAERSKAQRDDNPTIEKEQAERFAQLLTARGMNTELTSRSATDYCGRSSNNMNQWFLLNDYKTSSVQSLQLEIREKGFRTEYTIDATADIIAETISAFVKVVNSQAVSEDVKIEEAYIKLKGIFGRHFQNAMLEVGQYLVHKMYGDFNSAIKKEPRGEKSLAKLAKLIQQDSQEKGNAPSRTWIYDAVNLAIDNYLYKKKELPSVYGRLGHSHKVNLTYCKYTPKKDDDETKRDKNRKKYLKIKKALVEEAVDEKHSVALLRERIREEKQKLDGEDTSISLFNLPHKEVLMTKPIKTLRNLRASAEQKIQIYSGKLKRVRLAEKRIKSAMKKQKPTPAKLRKVIENNEWTLSRNNVNFQTGCSNACIYCYGRFMFNAEKLKKEAEKHGKKFHWAETEKRAHDIDAHYGLKDGRVGFPTSHDITPENLIDYLKVLGKLLRAGNKIMIITKPVLECIKAICEASAFFKDKILFRFTITGKSNEVLNFWEPHAPSYEHRLECLKYAKDAGFQTSVSIEPMLEYPRAQEMIDEMIPFVTDAIWFGKMSKITDIKKLPKYKDPDGRLKTELEKVEDGHSVENIKALYEIYKGNPKIKWKLAYKKVLGIPLPPAPGMDI